MLLFKFNCIFRKQIVPLLFVVFTCSNFIDIEMEQATNPKFREDE